MLSYWFQFTVDVFTGVRPIRVQDIKVCWLLVIVTGTTLQEVINLFFTVIHEAVFSNINIIPRMQLESTARYI